MDILSFKNKNNLDCLKCFNKQLSSNIEEMNAFGIRIKGAERKF